VRISLSILLATMIVCSPIRTHAGSDHSVGHNQQSAKAAPVSATPLDYEFFKARVEPIFAAKRPGHARCVDCHTSNPLFQLQPLRADGGWDDHDSQKNFQAAARITVPGNVKSPLLVHPLAQAAGGDFFHSGGKHWQSQSDEEWQTLKAWVMGAKAEPIEKVGVRIIQTNSAGDNVDIIDPATNTVVGVINGIEVPHGAGAAPDGSRIYISDESESSLDVVDSKSLAVTARVRLSGHPNNMAVSRDGRHVYVGIIEPPGGVDVIDTSTLQRIRTIPTKGTIHNVYVTPDGRYVVAGSIEGRTINVIDAQTDQPVWTVDMGLGVRPMAFNRNVDGSTKWIFSQLSDFNGFAVVDFATRKEIARIKNPDLPQGKSTVPEGADSSHGMAVTSDGSMLVVCSRLNNFLYVYSLPALRLIGGVELGGKGAAWVTLTPDGKMAYVANAVTNDVSVIDVHALKEVVRIPVGYVPKRNVTALLP
jgi:YVTN family beta-propeller protein